MSGTGVLPSQTIRQMIADGVIAADPAVLPDQVQPASLDLRLGGVAYRVRASFLAGEGNRLADRLDEFEMHRIDLSGGAVLEKGAVYVVPLMERLALPGGIQAGFGSVRRILHRILRPFAWQIALDHRALVKIDRR